MVQKAILPLLEFEKGREDEVFTAVREGLKKTFRRYLALILFGSAGTRHETASSDIDLLCVVPDAQAAEKARQAGETLTAMVRERYSKTLSFHVLTAREFRDRYRSGGDYVRDAVEKGTLLDGKLVSEIMEVEIG
jgi:predicted nucleotidyltransferase